MSSSRRLSGREVAGAVAGSTERTTRARCAGFRPSGSTCSVSETSRIVVPGFSLRVPPQEDQVLSHRIIVDAHRLRRSLANYQHHLQLDLPDSDFPLLSRRLYAGRLIPDLTPRADGSFSGSPCLYLHYARTGFRHQHPRAPTSGPPRSRRQ